MNLHGRNLIIVTGNHRLMAVGLAVLQLLSIASVIVLVMLNLVTYLPVIVVSALIAITTLALGFWPHSCLTEERLQAGYYHYQLKNLSFYELLFTFREFPACQRLNLYFELQQKLDAPLTLPEIEQLLTITEDIRFKNLVFNGITVYEELASPINYEVYALDLLKCDLQLKEKAVKTPFLEQTYRQMEILERCHHYHPDPSPMCQFNIEKSKGKYLVILHTKLTNSATFVKVADEEVFPCGIYLDHYITAIPTRNSDGLTVSFFQNDYAWYSEGSEIVSQAQFRAPLELTPYPNATSEAIMEEIDRLFIDLTRCHLIELPAVVDGIPVAGTYHQYHQYVLYIDDFHICRVLTPVQLQVSEKLASLIKAEHFRLRCDL